MEPFAKKKTPVAGTWAESNEECWSQIMEKCNQFITSEGPNNTEKR
jgi:hypothetical protein